MAVPAMLYVLEESTRNILSDFGEEMCCKTRKIYSATKDRKSANVFDCGRYSGGGVCNWNG